MSSNPSNNSASPTRSKLPLLPSERERLIKERRRPRAAEGASSGAEAEARLNEPEDPATETEQWQQGARSEQRPTQAAPDPAAVVSPAIVERPDATAGRLGRIRRYQDETFESHPPLPGSATSRILQDLLAGTGHFVNTFAADVDGRIRRCTDQTAELERQMVVLEGKLASVPDDG